MFIVTLTAVIGLCYGQQQSLPSLSPYQTQQLPVATATTPKPYYPPAQVHYVNIGEDLAGDYKFGYDTGKNGAGQSFREESRLPDGTVKGAYGYIDAEGKQRIVKYSAGIEGFKVESDEEAPGQPTGTAARNASPQGHPAPAPVQTYSPPPRQAAPLPVSAQPQQQLSSPITITRGDPQTLTLRTVANERQLPPISIRTYVAANDTSYGQYSPVSSAGSSSLQQQPAYRIISSSSPSTPSLTSSPSAASPYQGYTTVAQTRTFNQPQYISPTSQSLQPIISPTGTNQYSSSQSAYQQPTIPQRTTSPSATMTLSALLAHVARSSSNLSNSATTGNTQNLSSLLRQAQPATAYTSGSPFSTASIYGQQPASLVGQPQQAEQEATTWGPPVINKELLSYNIGVQQG
ncbi:hypothetical protein DERP_014680 [Dermatophagoides pteronyssinus]|uniref:Uncharacterized protein n=1 Tax=Dermatophagoides pteronyssinus TaxID=6956 RepID=A0ABQ8JRK3_DERPT|nr:hypothetical protein DERP_014680 [Dermatophagoides pteronyssinus]